MRASCKSSNADDRHRRQQHAPQPARRGQRSARAQHERQRHARRHARRAPRAPASGARQVRGRARRRPRRSTRQTPHTNSSGTSARSPADDGVRGRDRRRTPRRAPPARSDRRPRKFALSEERSPARADVRRREHDAGADLQQQREGARERLSLHDADPVDAGRLERPPARRSRGGSTANGIASVAKMTASATNARASSAKSRLARRAQRKAQHAVDGGQRERAPRRRRSDVSRTSATCSAKPTSGTPNTSIAVDRRLRARADRAARTGSRWRRRTRRTATRNGSTDREVLGRVEAVAPERPRART